MNIFNSLLAQLVKYDVHTTRKINSIHAIFYHILSLYFVVRARCRRKESSRSLSHLLMSFFFCMCHEQFALHVVIKLMFY